MEQVEYQNKLLVLKHLFLRIGILSKAGAEVQQIKFFSEYEALEFLFDRLYGYYIEFNHLPLYEQMATEIDLCGESFSFDPITCQQMKGMLYKWYSAPPQFNDDWVIDQIKGALQAHAVLSLRASLTGNELDLYDASQDIEVANQVFKTDIFSVPKDENPFDDPEAYLSQAARFPTGVGFLDEALDGGGQIGELLGFLAPSGGGKTTLGLQIADAQVRKKQHVVYLATEQELRGDLTVRSFCLALRCSRKFFKDDFSKLEPELQEQITQQTKDWREYFHFFDFMDKDIISIDAFFAPVDRLLAQGIQPVYIITDWWGDVRDALLNAAELRDETAGRRKGRIWVQELKNKGRSYNAINIVFHQLSGATAGKSAKSIASSHDAQEDKSLNNRMDYCFVMSKKDEKDEMKIFSDKTRRFKNMTKKLKLDGDSCLFQVVDSDDMSTPPVNTTTSFVSKRQTQGYMF